MSQLPADVAAARLTPTEIVLLHGDRFAGAAGDGRRAVNVERVMAATSPEARALDFSVKIPGRRSTSHASTEVRRRSPRP